MPAEVASARVDAQSDTPTADGGASKTDTPTDGASRTGTSTDGAAKTGASTDGAAKTGTSTDSATKTGTAPAGGDVKMSGMSILGNEEAPKSLVIVPWKSSQMADMPSVSRLLDSSTQPVDKDVFMRELAYYEIRSNAR